jgi:hypothetical protein
MFGPKPAGYISLFPVNANDSMQALVEYKGTGTGSHRGQLRFWYDIVDITSNAGSTGYIYTAAKVSLSKAAYQGGAIVERVEDKTLSGDLPQFPRFAISSLRVGQSKALTNEWVGYKWEITGRATTGPLANVPGQGDNFTMTWLHA